MADIHRVSEALEIRQRAKSLGCTEPELREAVKTVANLISLEHNDEICDWAMSLLHRSRAAGCRKSGGLPQRGGRCR
jgi:hypothetical protein